MGLMNNFTNKLTDNFLTSQYSECLVFNKNAVFKQRLVLLSDPVSSRVPWYLHMTAARSGDGQ
jgi:hypothetical protein